MNDLTCCVQHLSRVSRTFSIPIAELDPGLREAVTAGYLLCRVADTFEDEPALGAGARLELLADLIAMLQGRVAPGALAERFRSALPPGLRDTPPSDPEHALIRDLPRLMAVFTSLTPGAQQSLRTWVSEMAHGMSVYAARPAGPDGVHALTTLADLDRYCYFVAGTVGHLLTELFEARLPHLDPTRRMRLRSLAEHFGLGLQLTNILKDVTDDLSRGWCFVPRALLLEHGMAPLDMLKPDLRPRVHAALLPIFYRAEWAMDAAFRYTLAIPSEAADIRRFCLLPLWMAVRTLDLARSNDQQLVAGAPVKISRAEVQAIIAEVSQLCSDDDALRARYVGLSNGLWRSVA